MAPPQPVRPATRLCPVGMAYIPEGTFMRRFSNIDGVVYESPTDVVTVPGYCLDQYKVTNEQYAAAEGPKTAPRMQYQLFAIQCGGHGPILDVAHGTEPKALLKAHVDRLITDATICGLEVVQVPPPRRVVPEGLERSQEPVVDMTWDDADTFCRNRGTRLPTDAEWERAARGPFGTEDKRAANAPNVFGIYDLGIISEWVADWDGAEYDVPGSMGNPKGIYKVTRGWGGEFPPGLHAGGRSSGLPESHDFYRGFRCAVDPMNPKR